MLDIRNSIADSSLILYFVIGRAYVSVATRGSYYGDVLARLKEEMGEDFVKPVSLISSVRLIDEQDWNQVRDLEVVDYVFGDM